MVNIIARLKCLFGGHWIRAEIVSHITGYRYRYWCGRCGRELKGPRL